VLVLLTFKSNASESFSKYGQFLYISQCTTTGGLWVAFPPFDAGMFCQVCNCHMLSQLVSMNAFHFVTVAECQMVMIAV